MLLLHLVSKFQSTDGSNLVPTQINLMKKMRKESKHVVHRLSRDRCSFACHVGEVYLLPLYFNLPQVKKDLLPKVLLPWFVPPQQGVDASDTRPRPRRPSCLDNLFVRTTNPPMQRAKDYTAELRIN